MFSDNVITKLLLVANNCGEKRNEEALIIGTHVTLRIGTLSILDSCPLKDSRIKLSMGVLSLCGTPRVFIVKPAVLISIPKEPFAFNMPDSL